MVEVEVALQLLYNKLHTFAVFPTGPFFGVEKKLHMLWKPRVEEIPLSSFFDLGQQGRPYPSPAPILTVVVAVQKVDQHVKREKFILWSTDSNMKFPWQQVTGDLCRWPRNQSLSDPFGLDGAR